MAADPGQVWSSSVKVINNNPYAITVYADVVNFAPQGETGQGKFLPVFEDVTEGTTLAEWFDVSREPIELAPAASKSVPFTVRVPENANPGGHFAAILIGTRPPESEGSLQIGTSQIVTSLFFVRIAGEVIENGSIREFRATDRFVSQPRVNFAVRFENQGNVHIQPQGEIRITNMWGKERGVIPINHKTHFGNVLPESIRKFEFTWKGEQQFSDIGRYTAELTLAYGSDNRQFVSGTTHFWIVPVRPVLTVLAIIVFTILFIMWAVRAYVRRMLILEGVQPARRPNYGTPLPGDVRVEHRAKLDAPVRAGWLDLTTRLRQAQAFTDTLRTLVGFVRQYRLFFAAFVLAILIAATIWYLLAEALTESRDYEVTIGNPADDVTVSSEEILYERTYGPSESIGSAAAAGTSSQPYRITIVNSSDTPGAAAQVRRQLEPELTINDLQSDFGQTRERSVIVYHSDLQEEAVALRNQLGDFILSALPPETEERSITIYIGNDHVSE